MTLEEITQQAVQLQQEASQALSAAATPADLEALRVKYLGGKSAPTQWLKQIPGFPPEQRAALGKLANDFKRGIEEALATRRETLAKAPTGPVVDLTLPGANFPQGREHPITQTIDQILSLFVPLGFEIVEGPEMELEYYNFDGLNIPKEHPSRESFDTFFVDLPSPDPKKGKYVLRSHTSPVQVRVMEKQKPPIRIIVPGKVYRPDPLDPSHSFMFHQVEGLMVDDRTSFADLKGVLDPVLKSLFGPKTKTRFRPHFFPFTEPSAEVDIGCSSCQGKGCPTCGRKGWIEIMGCGMVHPNVFKAVGYNPSRVQGFAFGMGVERIAMLKHGISDIRLFFENDLRFLEQF